ncbi:MAG: CBS domain-containing protein [Planctomycetota bacterium]|jgi:CBS domain-containing protein
MTICPNCGQENIEGADLCDGCQSSLSSLSKPRPGSDVERRIFKDRIEQLPPRKPLVVAPETPVGEVLQCLVDRVGGCAVVAEKGEVVGIFTDRDALWRLNVEASSLADRPVGDFMTSPVETLEADAPVAFALHKMDLGGYRHLPILSEGRITGVISVRHLLNYLTAML